MAGSDLPFPNNARQENVSLFGGARFGRRKRTIFMLLLVAVFFVLWFNSDIDRMNTSLSENTSSTAKDTTSKTPNFVQDDVVEDDEASLQEEQEQEIEEEELNEQEGDSVPEEKPAKEEEEEFKHVEQSKEKPATAKYTPPNTIYKNKPEHFKYFIIIASRASNLNRRQLIRKTYFGFEDNIEPCMKRDKGINYLFWVYGDVPASRTAERRLYETEKMEWNDLEKVDQQTYSQDKILKWAESTLKDRGVTYDYLVIQDGYSIVQLNYIQQTINAEAGKLFIEGKDAKELVWTSSQHQNVLVAGSLAIQKLMDQESEVKDVIGSDNTLMANFYEFYRSISVQLNFVTSPKEISRLNTLKENLPIFITETDRFATWNNNVESVADMSIAVGNIYQDSDFASVAKKLSVGVSGVCKPLEKASIAVVTSSFIYADSCMEPSASRAADNKRKYALAHNYAFVARSAEFGQQDLRAEKRRPVWGKIDVVQKVLPKYDWIFWMDMDAVILNPDQTVQSILDQFRNDYAQGPREFENNIDLVIAKPTRDKMINAGVFFMRNTEWAQKFLNAVQESKKWYNQGPSYEQGAMWDLIQLPGYKEHVLLLENDDHTFNTLPRRYIPGDFIVHFAPDKCPNAAVLNGLKAADQIQQGEIIASFKED